MILKEYVRGVIGTYIKENVQLADKVYFNTGKLSKQDKDEILSITRGDQFTKLMSDFYYHIKNHGTGTTSAKEELTALYNDVKTYDKNKYPIKGYDAYDSELGTGFIISALKYRRKIIKHIKELPSMAERNLKNDIRKERDNDELYDYMNDLEYFMGYYSLLNNREEKIRHKILRKLFKANITLDDMLNFVNDKYNLLGGVSMSKNKIIELSKQEDITPIYNKNNVMIIKVESPDGIKAIGCNSLWCFTYGSGFQLAYQQWNNYSHNDIVYVIVDFNKNNDSEEFMHVLISPLTDGDELIDYGEGFDGDDTPLFDMSNDNVYKPYNVLERLFGSGYEDIIKTFLNFDE